MGDFPKFGHNYDTQGPEGAHLSEPQKAHLTSEFVVVKIMYCFDWSL